MKQKHSGDARFGAGSCNTEVGSFGEINVPFSLGVIESRAAFQSLIV